MPVRVWAEVPVRCGFTRAVSAQVWALVWKGDGSMPETGVAVWLGRVAVKLGHLLSTNPTDTITDVSWLCVFQEIHELFQDYELKYCYVDRNKRTGERSVPSTQSCFDFSRSCYRAGKLAVFCLPVFFRCWELNLRPLRVMASIQLLGSIRCQLWSF